jgi:hypothetical protein
MRSQLKLRILILNVKDQYTYYIYVKEYIIFWIKKSFFNLFYF